MKSRLLPLMLLALAWTSPALAQVKLRPRPPALTESQQACVEAGDCRKVGVVSYPEGDYPINTALPWVKDGMVHLVSGETVVFRLEARGEALVPVFVAAGTPELDRELQPGELRATLSAPEKGALLKIESAYQATLDYRAIMINVDDKARATSVCPLMTGLSVFESWGDRIPYLVFGDFKAVAADSPEGRVCD